MKYIGSKRRIAKDILPIICKSRRYDQWYVEPFVGGGNCISEVIGRRLGSDVNMRIIEALKLIRDDPYSLPKNNKEFTKEHYQQFIKGTLDLSDGMKGYAGYTYSFGAMWRGSWAKCRHGRDYVKQAFNSAVKQSRKLKGCILLCCSYDQLEIPENAIIYCDPPYRNTLGYGLDFDHDKFWDWVRLKTKQGHSVFVSEYTAPSDFVCVFEKEISCKISCIIGNNDKRVERLFKWRYGYGKS